MFPHRPSVQADWANVGTVERLGQALADDAEYWPRAVPLCHPASGLVSKVPWSEAGSPPRIRVEAVFPDCRLVQGGCDMRLELDDGQIDLLRVLLDTALRDLNYEIADTDLPAYRHTLRERRETLRVLLDMVGGRIPNEQRFA
jgi:hypothetical protein